MLRGLKKNSTEEAIEHSYQEPQIYFKTQIVSSEVKHLHLICAVVKYTHMTTKGSIIWLYRHQNNTAHNSILLG